MKIPERKFIIVDGVYSGENTTPADHKKMSLPSNINKGELQNFKVRVRSLHENFNGRVRDFNAAYVVVPDLPT